MADNYPLVQPPEWQQNVPAGLAGMLYSQDRARYDNRAGLQDLVMGAQTKATLRDLPVQSRKLEAETRDKELGVEYTQATQPGRIQVTGAEQQTALGNQQLLQMQQRMAIVDALSRVGGPTAVQQIGDAIKQLGMDPRDPFISSLLNVQNPAEVPVRARAAREALSAQYSQAMDVERLRGDYDLQGRRISAQASRDAARISARGKTKTLREEWNSENDPVKKAALAGQILSSSEADETLKREALATVQQNAEMVQAILKRGQMPYHPALPQPPNARLPGQDSPTAPRPPRPQAGGLPPGVERIK